MQPATEPAHALLGGAVGERFRHDASLRLLLQAVVADGRRRGERLFDFSRFDDVLRRIGAMSPYAREAIGLQFLAYR